MLNAATPDHSKTHGKKTAKKPLSRRVSFRSSAVSAVGVTGGDAMEYALEMAMVDRDVIPVSTDARGEARGEVRANPLSETKVDAAAGPGLGAQAQGLEKELGVREQKQGLVQGPASKGQGQGLATTTAAATTPTNPVTATKNVSEPLSKNEPSHKTFSELLHEVSSRTKPSPSSQPLSQSLSQSSSLPQPLSQASASGTKLPLSKPLSEPLPEGVTAHLDTESGKYFYTDPATKETSWTIPGM